MRQWPKSDFKDHVINAVHTLMKPPPKKNKNRAQILFTIKSLEPFWCVIKAHSLT